MLKKDDKRSQENHKKSSSNYIEEKMKEGSFFGRWIGFKGRKKSGNGCTDITTKDIRNRNIKGNGF